MAFQIDKNKKDWQEPPILSVKTPTRGLLFIGDPHLWSKRPGRRRDPSFLKTVLIKLEACAHISNQHQLWPIILGDLFDKATDHEPHMLNPLIKILQSFERKPVTLVGNHDKNERKLTEHNALRLLETAQQIDVLDSPGFWGMMDLEDLNGDCQRILIGGTPYGTELDDDLMELSLSPISTDHILKKTKAKKVIWLTHDDLAFEGAYPNARPLIDIKGVDLVVNGHMHAPKKPVKVGDTVWYNPGNITRMSVDVANQIPRAWSWSPFSEEKDVDVEGKMIPKLTPHDLPHRPAHEIFDLEGRHAQAVLNPNLSTQLSQDEHDSVFVSLFKQENLTERTDDAAFVREEMPILCEKNKISSYGKQVLAQLLEETLSQYKG